MLLQQRPLGRQVDALAAKIGAALSDVAPAVRAATITGIVSLIESPRRLRTLTGPKGKVPAVLARVSVFY